MPSFRKTFHHACQERRSPDRHQNGTWTYTYDAVGQLIQAVFVSSNTSVLPNQDLHYVYDAAGNRISETVNGVATTYAVNRVNEYTSSTTPGVGTTTYQYDLNGNLISTTDPSNNTTTYTFNDLNQLTAVNGPNLTANYTYDWLGSRVSQTINGVTTKFQIDPTGSGNVVAEYDGSGNLIVHYTYGIGLVSQVTAGSSAAYYDFSRTGNTVGITGSAGAYVNQYAYLPFGQTLVVTATLANPFTFVGQFGVMNDGSGTIHIGARQYNPANGQYLSADSYGLSGGGFNLRSYVDNSPTNAIDPSGHCGPWHIEYQPLLWVIPWWAAVPDTLTPAESNDWPKVFSPDYSPTTQTGTWYPVFNDQNQNGAEYYNNGTCNVPVPNTGTPGYNNNGVITPTAPNRGDPPNAGGPGGTGGGCGDNSPPPASPTPPGNPGPGGDSGNHTSHDPNALIGPAGYGTQGFIQPNGTWPYTVDFENDGTAAALDVTVTEQLDPNLNWSTFQLGSFGFGSVNITVPPGLTQYQTTVAYHNSDGTALNVKVALDFNVQTGLLTVTFASIDPATGVAPTGVLDGFLPPDNSSLVGEGFVQYTVQPKAGLATGATISAQAAVVFDTNSAIQTKTVLNTIDATPPTSSVNPLPATETSPNFTVSWSGSDANGPGIASYNVYVSVNGGAFTPWLTDTTQTSATYSGQYGNHYSFYSVAIDNSGLSQPTPSGAQATTYVWVPPSPPPAPPTAPPTLIVPPLLAFVDSLLGAIETVNGNGTETVTDSIFGIQLFVSTFDGSGNLMNVSLFGFNVTFFFV